MFTLEMHPILCIFLSLLSTATISPTSLENKAYTDYASELDENRSSLWFPSPGQPIKIDFKLMQICDTGDFARLTDILKQHISSHTNRDTFQWTTISLGSTRSPKFSYVLLGGSNARSHSGDSASPRTGSLVLLCHFEKIGIHTIRLSSEACTPLSSTNGQHEYLGASGSSFKWNDTSVVFAYCDPLWRPDPKVPLGRCFLHLVQGRPIAHEVQETSFCRSGDAGGTPCGAGFSVALTSDSSPIPPVSPSASQPRKARLSDLHLWVGQPLFDTNGRLQIVHDPFGEKTLTTINNPGSISDISIGTGFGSALIDGYATASGYGATEPSSETNSAALVGVYLSTSAGKDYGMIEWLAGSNESDQFTGFGIALTRVSLKNLVGVVVGAPYATASLMKRQTQGNTAEGLPSDRDRNRGRIYLYCHSNSQSREFSEKEYLHTYDDYLDGPTDSSHFGYSLSSIDSDDGAGVKTIAVGAPDLDGRHFQSHVYLVRILATCRFDRRPLQTIQGPPGATDFGAHLPAKSEDLDFNNWPDIMIPFSPKFARAGFPSPLTLLGRPQLEVECNFEFPPWLSVQRITENDMIPVGIRVFLHRADSRQQAIDNYFGAQDVRSLTHQINPDWNASSKEGQRFSVAGAVNAQLNIEQGIMKVSFNLKAKRKVEDMSEVDSVNKGVFVGYRFLKACNLRPQGCGSCPLIDWSGCVARLPVIRFVCYPRPSCESSVALRITDSLSKRLIFTPKNLEQQDTQAAKDSPAEVQMDLTFGDQRHALPKLEIEVLNFGPTMAGGVWLVMQFHGNLRFARLEVIINGLANGNPFTSVSDNETWAACRLNNLPAPTINDPEDVGPFWHLKLVTYYNGFNSIDDTNFLLGAGVNITVITGTFDPEHRDNSVYLNYRIVNRPRFRVSRGPKVLSAHIDNRSEPIYWKPGFQRRIELSDLGPRVQHTFQAEYLGPMPSLKNVYFRVFVPAQLAEYDSGRRTDLYLVYLFQHIRVIGKDWLDVTPTVTSYSDTSQQPDVVGRCQVQNYETFLNPRQLVGMDSSRAHFRQRRSASTFDENDPDVISPSLNSSSNTNGRQPTRTKPTFRRTPKEVLQCDRVGYFLDRPVCAEIVCYVENLRVNRPVTLTFTGWLWARTMFARHISDVDLVSTLTINQGDIPPGVIAAQEPVSYFHLSQTFFFPQIRPKRLQQIPIWPIVVGVFVGVFFLALLVILLYLLGFFKRRKPALRKARWTRGGADELERQVIDNEKAQAEQPHAEPVRPEEDRHGRRKHRRKLEIVHPTDIPPRQDEQRLLEADSG